MHLACDHASSAANWRLFLPESWDDTTITDPEAAAETQRRRQRCAIPDTVRHREKWRLALDILDEVAGEWELPERPVVADAGYGDTTGFRLGLTERGLEYVVAVKPTTSAHPVDAVPEQPAYPGRGRPPHRDTPRTRRTYAPWC